MTRSERPAVALAGMIIATIYVIMLIGLTRSSYFIGGGALQSGPVIAVNRVAPLPASDRAVCVAPATQVAELQACVQETRTLRRALGLSQD